MTNNNHSTDSSEKVAGKNILAVFSYLWILIVIPFLTDAKNDPFVKYHLKQGLALIIFEAIGWIAGFFLIFIPILGSLITTLWWLAALILTIVGVVNVLGGKEAELPVIGHYAKSFNF
jgi:uncharacterized membrane protein